MIFRLFIMSLFFCISTLLQGEIAVKKEDVVRAVSEFSEAQKDQKDEMVAQLLKLERPQLIEILKGFDKMSKEDLDNNFGPDAIVLDTWYKTLEKNVFDSEKERKKFEDAVENGKLVALDEEKEFAVIEIQDALYIVSMTQKGAQEILVEFQEVLEAETGKFFANQEEDETDEAFEARKSVVQKELEKQMELANKKAEEAKKVKDKDKKKAEKLIQEAQKIAQKAQEEFGENAKKALDIACNQCFEKFGLDFLYGMLVFRMSVKASKPMMIEAIKIVKEKIRKR